MLALLLIPLGQAWTVDDDGPADFSSLQAAVDAVAPGDTLLVHPGSYGAVDMAKPLAVVSASGAPFEVSQLSIHDVPSFTLAGARITEGLAVERVPGRGVIEDVHVGGLGPAPCFPVQAGVGHAGFTACAELVVGRSSFQGGDGFYPDQGAGVAATILASLAAFDACSFAGGAAEVCGDSHPTPGGGAVDLGPGALVFFSGCSLTGGPGNPSSIFTGVTPGGPALRLLDAAADVRGSAVHVLSGGESYQAGLAVGPAESVVLAGASSAVVSGVSVLPPALPPGVFVPQPALPYLLLGGSDAPGGVRTLELFGPAGSTALAAAGLLPALFLVPGLAPEPIWLSPAGLVDFFALVAAGQDTPVTHAWPLPADPALAGVAVHVQAWVSPASSPQHLTAPGGIVLRW